MKQTITPCKDCAERHAGCHAECEKYAAWKKESELQAEAIRTARNMDKRNMRHEITTSSKMNRIVSRRKK